MLELKNLTDLAVAFGSRSQEVLDFISDETNQRKFKRYLDFKSNNVVAKPDTAGGTQTTQIRIAMTGGKFLTKNEWTNGNYDKNDVIGIAVITPCVKFILGLKEWKERWSEGPERCIIGEHDEAQALQIISGYEATKEITEAQEDEENTAAKLCWNYGYKGLQWYLPCLLELNAVCANKEEINELLKLVGGDPLSLDECYWSSPEYSAYTSWCVSFYSGSSYNYIKYNTGYVRPAVAI